MKNEREDKKGKARQADAILLAPFDFRLACWCKKIALEKRILLEIFTHHKRERDGLGALL